MLGQQIKKSYFKTNFKQKWFSIWIPGLKSHEQFPLVFYPYEGKNPILVSRVVILHLLDFRHFYVLDGADFFCWCSLAPWRDPPGIILWLVNIYHTRDGGTDHRASHVSLPTQCIAVLGGLHWVSVTNLMSLVWICWWRVVVVYLNYVLSIVVISFC